jgi:perosamine synthetase
LANSFKIDAVIIVHIGGYVSKEIDEILTYCKKNDYIFLEDCAHAHGSKYKGNLLGTLGFASILSFFPTKLVNGAEGGALITSDEDLAAFASKWRNQGKSGTFGNHHEVLGGSYRMSEFNCALAVLNYDLLDDEIQKRMFISTELISARGQVNFSRFDHMDIFSCYKLIAQHPNFSGEEVEEKLRNKGIICGGAVYRRACHSQPVFSELSVNTSLYNTENFSYKHFCLPVHSGVSSDDLDRIKNALKNL